MRKGVWINGLIVGSAIACGVLASQGPWQMLRQQRERTAKQTAEMRESEAEREQLLREESRYRNSVGREELARSQGYLAPGEKPLGAN